MVTHKKWNAIVAIIGHEVQCLRRKKILLLLVLIYPVLAMVFFLCMFSTGVITKIPVAIIDEDNSESSRLVIQKLSASPSIRVFERFSELPAAKHSLLNGDVFAVIWIPSRFESDAFGGKQPAIVSFINGQYMTVAKTLNDGIARTLLSLNGKQLVNNIVKQTGTSAIITQKQLVAIPVNFHPLFNPTLNYYYNLGSGLFPTILQLLIMMMGGVSILNDLLDPKAMARKFQLANKSLFLFLFAKLVPYFLLYLAYLTIFDLILILNMDLPTHGSLKILFLGHMLFIAAALLFGALVALIAGSRTKMLGMVSVFASPAFGFSGLVFPRIAMNGFAYFWGAMLPTTWYMEIRLEQTLRNFGSWSSYEPMIALLIIICVLILLIVPVARLRKIGE